MSPCHHAATTGSSARHGPCGSVLSPGRGPSLGAESRLETRPHGKSPGTRQSPSCPDSTATKGKGPQRSELALGAPGRKLHSQPVMEQVLSQAHAPVPVESLSVLRSFRAQVQPIPWPSGSIAPRTPLWEAARPTLTSTQGHPQDDGAPPPLGLKQRRKAGAHAQGPAVSSKHPPAQAVDGDVGQLGSQGERISQALPQH